MKRTRHTPEQIVCKLREADRLLAENIPLAEVMRYLEISHQPHEGGDGAKCGAKFPDTPCIISIEVTRARQTRKETEQQLTKNLLCSRRRRRREQQRKNEIDK